MRLPSILCFFVFVNATACLNVENEKKKGRGASSDFLREQMNPIYTALQNLKSGVMLFYPLSSTVRLFYLAFQCFRKFKLGCSTVLIELGALCLQLLDKTSHAMLTTRRLVSWKSKLQLVHNSVIKRCACSTFYHGTRLK